MYSRVIIPPQAHDRVIKVIHIAYSGIARTKNLICQFVWWTKSESDLEVKINAVALVRCLGINYVPQTTLHS